MKRRNSRWALGLLGLIAGVAACVVPTKDSPSSAPVAVSEPALDPSCPVEIWRAVVEDEPIEVASAPSLPAPAVAPVAPVAPVVVAPPVVEVAEVVVAEEPMVPVTQHVAPGSPVGTSAGALTEADNAESRARLLSQPTPWLHGPITRFKVSSDPAADRAASLAARARLRAFEGAPPTMPHSDSYSAGSKTCLDCHQNGSSIGDRIAHPMPHPVLINCRQCHIEETSRLYDELITPGSHLSSALGNTFEGQFFERAGEVSIAGGPPMMPHGTFMRTECLSCHGEFGYPGLQTPHPDRQNCLQCHIMVAPR